MFLSGNYTPSQVTHNPCNIALIKCDFHPYGWAEGPSKLKIRARPVSSGRSHCDTVVSMTHPWWVNLSIVIPSVSYFLWRREPFSIGRGRLLAGALFAASFGVVEGIVVVFLRAVVGAVTGYCVSVPCLQLTPQSAPVHER